MKKLAILTLTGLVIAGMPLYYGYKNLNRIKIKEVPTIESNSNCEEEAYTTKSESNSNWVEEFNKVGEELKQERLKSDIELSVIRICVGVNDEVSKGMIVDCLVDVHGYDRELVSEVIDRMGWDWKYNCKKTFKGLLNEGFDPDRIPLMLKELQFTEEEIQYAIDNH